MTTPIQKPGRSRRDYSTPADFIEAVKRRLWIDEFVLDLAAGASNTKARGFFGPGSHVPDALAVRWADYIGIGPGVGWLNPPFNDITPWAEKCAQTAKDGSRVAFLVPASVGSNWFRDHVDGKALVLFLNGRLKFLPDKPKWLYPKDCMLCLFGPNLRGSEVWTWKEPKRREVAA